MDHNQFFVLEATSVNFIDTDGMHAIKEALEAIQKKK